MLKLQGGPGFRTTLTMVYTLLSWFPTPELQEGLMQVHFALQNLHKNRPENPKL